MKEIMMVFLIVLGFSPLVYAQEQKPISVLIIDGFSNHDWKQTTAVTKWILESSDNFDVDVSTVPADSEKWKEWAPPFEEYDVILQNTNNIHDESKKWPENAEKNLEEYVKSGGGLYILHSANNAFSHWEEYDKMIGLGWRPQTTGYALEIGDNQEIVRIPPGEGQGTGHGDRFDAEIQVLNSHPINRDYPESWKTAHTEVYSYPRGPAENLNVLSFAYDSTDTHRLWPVEWVVSYGDGRVYNSSLGHLWSGEIYPEAYRCVGFQTTLIRAVEWAATGEVTYPVPDNFPTKNNKSLRSKADFPDSLR